MGGRRIGRAGGPLSDPMGYTGRKVVGILGGLQYLGGYLAYRFASAILCYIARCVNL
jgi:hypothetical protein